MTVLMTARNERTFRELERELEAAGRSPKTISAYHQALLSLERHLGGADLTAVTKTDMVSWLTALRATHAKDSIVSYFTSVRRFYNWAVAEQLLGASPMARLTAPPASGKPVAIPAEADVRALLKACEGRGFAELRDMAIIRLFCETGSPRLSEVALLPMDRLDMRTDYVTVVGKGGKWRRFPLAAVTARALSKYLRARDAQPWAERTDRVFIGPKGPLLPDSVHKIVKRRCAQAGIAPIHPHQLRHFGTHRAKSAGMAEQDIMQLNGWSTTRMLARYGAAAAEQRAAAASRRLSLANQL
jgi:site-specific recombinase XerD